MSTTHLDGRPANGSTVNGPAVNGSAPARGPSSTAFTIHEETLPSVFTGAGMGAMTDQGAASQVADAPVPLMPSKLGNVTTTHAGVRVPSVKRSDNVNGAKNEQSEMAALLATLAHQEALLKKQQEHLHGSDNENYGRPSKNAETSSESSVPITPASGSGSGSLTGTNGRQMRNEVTSSEADEVERLRRQLAEANTRLAQMDQELSQTRITKHTLDQALGSPSESDFRVPAIVTEQTISSLQGALNASTRASLGRTNSWGAVNDGHSKPSDAASDGPFGKPLPIWGNPRRTPLQSDLARTSHVHDDVHGNIHGSVGDPPSNWNHGPIRPPAPQAMGQGMFSMAPQLSLRGMMGSQFQGMVGHGGGLHDSVPLSTFQSSRRSQAHMGRGGPSHNHRAPGWGAYPTNVGLGEGAGSRTAPYQSHNLIQPANEYRQLPIGTPLSATAPEFKLMTGQRNAWLGQTESAGQTYVSPLEPLNYRRLLDRTVSCNWKYIVDKIVCSNDQQASIFLQQKLKIGSPEQKHEIVDAIVAQAYPLMVNRFGNFLVQRCFEHGNAQQITAIANAIRGNTLSLSMDSFGCHVVQKAFDCVPEEYKAIMVHELLRRIPETVIHRYACHVWQKLFELRWNDSPPQIMKYVNEALRGMWPEVALGETGSLVVQNIFENCLEEDKRPCINEVLASIDLVARGQFGNWCIQHICEQGMPADRSRAIDHILRYSVEYSMDQFASKVVEKCLKIGGPDFLERYLSRVCEGRTDRPRIPLIDIASDQYGNYLIQHILTHANPHHREVVASHVRKHMVSLRGSKFGAKVGMLCCNPAYITRPGPGAGPYITRYNPGRFGGVYR